MLDEARRGALEARLAVAGERQAKRLINFQRGLRDRDLSRLRHQVELGGVEQRHRRYHPTTECGDFHRSATHNDRLRKVEEEILAKAYDSRLMRRLLGYLRPYAGYIAL